MAGKAQLDPNWWKKNAPESIEDGEVAKALSEVSKANANLEKSGDFNAYTKAIEKLKAGISKDEAAAKKAKDNEAVKLLADLKKAASEEGEEKKGQLTLKEGGSEKGPGGQGGVAVPEAKGGGDDEAVAAKGGDEGGVSADTIINGLKTAWDIIKDNKPAAEAKSSFCQAVPDGIKFTDLHDWKPESTSWPWVKENLYGVDVVNAEFQCDYLWNGQTDSVRGLFLNNFNVWCKSIDVLIGFQVNVNATVSGNAFNSGTKDAPVGAIPLLISAQVSGVFQNKTTTWKITCHGNRKREVA